MFQMERTIILEQIPEHFNVQRVVLDGLKFVSGFISPVVMAKHLAKCVIQRYKRAR